jgi:hypothetical protein
MVLSERCEEEKVIITDLEDLRAQSSDLFIIVKAVTRQQPYLRELVVRFLCQRGESLSVKLFARNPKAP